MDFLSPFSSNPSTLKTNADSSVSGADRNTLFELEVM
jgi:hypothetical protein